MKTVSALLVAGILSAVATTEASALTGTELQNRCRDKISSIGELSCTAYLRGFLDGMVFGTFIGKTDPNLFCTPEGGIAADQARKIVADYMKAHPEKLHLEAGALAANAMTAAFPCPLK